MANAIELSAKYQPLLDEVYAEASLTKDLENSKVKFDNSATVKILKVKVPELGDYSRNSGFTSGNVEATWESWTLSQDRGREFSIDAMDDEETLDMTFGSASSEFVRTKVTREVDMYRFAKIAQTTGITKTSGTLEDGDAIEKAISTAKAKLTNDEVPKEGRLLYIDPESLESLRTTFARRFNTKTDITNRSFETYDGMKVIEVPSSRFVDKITKNNSTKAYEKAEDGKNIKFMIVAPGAVEAVAKHVKLRVFTPDENQSMDAYKFQYRIYHDLFVYENKVAGVYVYTEE